MFSLKFRTRLAALLAAAAALPAIVTAQGRIIERPCQRPPVCPTCAIVQPRCAPAPSRVEHTSTQVRVRLADRVLRYEVVETFVNRGGNLGEADYVFPLPSQSAFEDVRL
ncbi:MAG: VIT domain-containing protein [Gemmatimonas sp.]